MNLHHILRFALVLTLLLLRPPDAPAGRPGPAHRQPPQYRQANMLLLRFQDALAEERWADALALCSDRVRSKAAGWPAPKDFFTDTMPIEHVLAYSWGCWSCGTNFYGMFATISDDGVTPRLDWYWAVVPAGERWVIDYPPVKLVDYIANKKAAFQERDEREAAIRRELAPQAQHLTTRLTALTNRFVVGAPMPFRLEIINAGPAPVYYQEPGVRHYGLSVTDAKNAPVPYGDPPAQIGMGGPKLLAAGATDIIADRLDINRYLALQKPGRYIVQFNSPGLRLGRPVPIEDAGRFGENLSPGFPSDFLSVTNTFPSNVIEIEVQP